jgi:predicted ATPase
VTQKAEKGGFYVLDEPTAGLRRLMSIDCE